MRTIIFFLSLFLIISCDKQNEPKQQEQHNEFYGSWYLIEFKSWGQPVSEYTSEIKWTFDNNTVDVSIVNGTDVPSYILLSNNGTYSYTINNNHDIIYFYHNNNQDGYRYKIINDTLLLDNFTPYSDGAQITLIKTN